MFIKQGESRATQVMDTAFKAVFVLGLSIAGPLVGIYPLL